MNAIGTVRDMATCLRVARVLQHYLDHEIDPRTAERVRAHLETCRKCGLDAATYHEIKSALARRDVAPPDGAVLSRLRAFAASLEEVPES